MAHTTHHIEEILSHQEQQIQDLSDMVTRQWQEIDQLKKALISLQQKMVTSLQDITEARGEGLSVTEQALRDKPPHY